MIAHNSHHIHSLCDAPTLFPYQRAGADQITALWERGQDVLLGDPPGAGKTPQAIVAKEEYGAATALIICPASLRENWRREYVKWAGDAHRVHVVYGNNDAIPVHDILIVSYNLATILTDPDSPYAHLSWDILILDEAHFLKSRHSGRTRAVLGNLWPRCKRRLALTGTPVPNGRAAEAWPLFSRLSPKLFGDADKYIARYCIKKDTPYGVKYPWSRNLRELGGLARATFMIRRSRKEVLADLPPFSRTIISLTERHPNLGMEHAAEALSFLETGVILSFAISAVRRRLGLLKVSPAAEFIEELDASHVVIFVHHKEVFTGMQEELDRRGISFVSLQGSTPPHLRQAAVDDFQAGKVRVFLASLLAANTGLTLTRASTAVIVEPSWVPSENEQGEGRIRRVGQNEITRVFYLTIPDTLDDVMTTALLRKQRDIGKVMGEEEDDKNDKNGEDDNDDRYDNHENTEDPSGATVLPKTLGT